MRVSLLLILCLLGLRTALAGPSWAATLPWTDPEYEYDSKTCAAGSVHVAVLGTADNFPVITLADAVDPADPPENLKVLFTKVLTGDHAADGAAGVLIIDALESLFVVYKSGWIEKFNFGGGSLWLKQISDHPVVGFAKSLTHTRLIVAIQNGDSSQILEVSPDNGNVLKSKDYANKVVSIAVDANSIIVLGGDSISSTKFYLEKFDPSSLNIIASTDFTVQRGKCKSVSISQSSILVAGTAFSQSESAMFNSKMLELFSDVPFVLAFSLSGTTISYLWGSLIAQPGSGVDSLIVTSSSTVILGGTSETDSNGDPLDVLISKFSGDTGTLQWTSRFNLPSDVQTSLSGMCQSGDRAYFVGTSYRGGAAYSFDLKRIPFVGVFSISASGRVSAPELSQAPLNPSTPLWTLQDKNGKSFDVVQSRPGHSDTLAAWHDGNAAFVGSYNWSSGASGPLLWSAKFESSSSDIINGIADVPALSAVFVSGGISGKDGTGFSSSASHGSDANDAFVSAVSEGAVSWVDRISSSGDDLGYTVYSKPALNPSDAWDIFVCGYGLGTMTGETSEPSDEFHWGGETETVAPTVPTQTKDGFVRKLVVSPSGTRTVSWHRRLLSDHGQCSDALIDGDDDVWVIGTTQGSMRFRESIGGSDAFIARFSEGSGEHFGTILLGSSGNDFGKFIIGDDDNTMLAIWERAVIGSSDKEIVVTRLTQDAAVQTEGSARMSGWQLEAHEAMVSGRNIIVVGSAFEPTTNRVHAKVWKFSAGLDLLWSSSYGDNNVASYAYSVTASPLDSSIVLVSGTAQGRIGAAKSGDYEGWQRFVTAINTSHAPIFAQSLVDTTTQPPNIPVESSGAAQAIITGISVSIGVAALIGGAVIYRQYENRRRGFTRIGQEDTNVARSPRAGEASSRASGSRRRLRSPSEAGSPNATMEFSGLKKTTEKDQFSHLDLSVDLEEEGSHPGL